jgi:hypothetical protein
MFPCLIEGAAARQAEARDALGAGLWCEVEQSCAVGFGPMHTADPSPSRPCVAQAVVNLTAAAETALPGSYLQRPLSDPRAGP